MRIDPHSSINQAGSKTSGSPLDVSVIVPMHNSAKYIERCLDSLLRQTYSPTRYEIIVVDNNSTDDSGLLVAKYPRIRLLSEPKQGSYAARNCGVKAADGQFLAFTDADCAPDMGWLSEILAPLASPEVKIVQGRRLFAGKSQILSMLADFETERAAYGFSSEGAGTHFGYTNNMAMRREIFDQCGPFLEIARGADSVFVDRVVKRFSIDAVHFSRTAIISHLEMTSVTRWLTKRVIRGRSLQQTRQIREYKRPASKILPVILKRTVERGHYSKAGAAYLYLIVLMGTLAFDLGRVSSSATKISAEKV
jgi:glycosyltransferase involved in cell wall biosynthesis